MGDFGKGNYITKFWDLQNVRCNEEFVYVGFDLDKPAYIFTGKIHHNSVRP